MGRRRAWSVVGCRRWTGPPVGVVAGAPEWRARRRQLSTPLSGEPGAQLRSTANLPRAAPPGAGSATARLRRRGAGLGGRNASHTSLAYQTYASVAARLSRLTAEI